MRVQRAFRRAGGSRGVDDQRGIVGARSHRLEVFAHCSQGRVQILAAAHRAIDAEYCFQIGNIGADLLDLAETARIRDQDFHARVLQAIA